MRYEVEFKNGRWGFTVFHGDKELLNTWDADGFPMARNPDSIWERQQVESVAKQAAEDADRVWAALDRITET